MPTHYLLPFKLEIAPSIKRLHFVSGKEFYYVGASPTIEDFKDFLLKKLPMEFENWLTNYRSRDPEAFTIEKTLRLLKGTDKKVDWEYIVSSIRINSQNPFELTNLIKKGKPEYYKKLIKIDPEFEEFVQAGQWGL